MIWNGNEYWPWLLGIFWGLVFYGIWELIGLPTERTRNETGHLLVLLGRFLPVSNQRLPTISGPPRQSGMK
jgi:hypothetical protein